MESTLQKIFTKEHVISVVFILLAAAALALIRRYYRTHRAQFMQSEGKRASSRILYDIVCTIITALTALVVLQINGINVTSIVTGLGIVSVIVGLALQDPLRDIIMGLHIMRDHFFAEGDVVEFGGVTGIVTSFSVESTKIQSLEDGSVLMVCNRDLCQVKKIGDAVILDLPLAYEEDFHRVHEVLKSACSAIAAAKDVRGCHYLGTNDFGSSAILYRIRIECDPRQRSSVRRTALAILQERLDREHISIPYDQLDVHCKPM